jgi:hypothetical protein
MNLVRTQKPHEREKKPENWSRWKAGSKLGRSTPAKCHFFLKSRGQ